MASRERAGRRWWRRGRSSCRQGVVGRARATVGSFSPPVRPSDFDTLLAVYRGIAQPNTTYRIAVDGFNGAAGRYFLRFTRQ